MQAGLAVDIVLLTAGALLVVGMAASGLAERLRVPGGLLLLGIGMAVGDDGMGWIRFDDTDLAQSVAVAALALILFEGGLSTRRSELRAALGPSLALATAGVVVTAGVVAAVVHLAFGVETTTALLVGSVVASTDAAAVFASLRGAPVPARPARILSAESGLNDPVAALLTIGVLEAWRQDPSALDWISFGVVQLVGGALIGVGIGLVAAAVVRRQHGRRMVSPEVLTLAVAGLAYGGAAVVGASGLLAAFLAGVVLGDRTPRQRLHLIAFHRSLATAAEVGLFLILGLLIFPSELAPVAGRGLIVAGALVLVARPLAVLVCLVPFRLPRAELAIVSWAGLRGAVPIVLATYAITEDVPGGRFVLNTVFFVVLVSVALQGTTVAALARRLGLVGAPRGATVLDSVPIETAAGDVVELRLTAASRLCGRRLRDVPPPAPVRIVSLVRDGDVVVPDGDSQLRADDLVLVVVPASVEDPDADLEAWAAPVEGREGLDAG